MTERETLFFGRSEIFVRFGLDRHIRAAVVPIRFFAFMVTPPAYNLP